MSFSKIYVNTCVQLHNLHLKLVQLNVSIFNLSMFSEEDGTAINNVDIKEF